MPAQAGLAGAGWDVADLRGRSTAHAIAKELVTARYDQKSKLVLIDTAALLMPPRVAHPAVERNGAALRRIEEGEYGYCEVTGEPISLGRLEARPIATMTIEAQERHERQEKVSRDD